MRIIGLLAVAFVAACTLKTEKPADNEAVNAGSDTASTEANMESLSSSFVGGSGTGSGLLSSQGQLVGGDTQTQALGDAAKAYYQPAGCLVVTDQPLKSMATYAFNGCTGPYGLVKLTGTIMVDYSAPAANPYTLKFSTTNFQINGSTIDTWNATAVITANGTARDMTWNGQFSGTTAHGRAFSRTNQKHYTWVVGGTCLTVSGTSDGTVTGKELKTDIKSWSQCAGSCPEPGSEITITDVPANQVYDLKFGTGDATYTGPNGGTVTFTPVCAL